MKLVVIVAVLVLAGCPDRNSPEHRMHAALEKMSKAARDVCACKDKACADKIQEDLMNWSTKMARDSAQDSKNYRADDETMKKMTDVGQKYAECMIKVMSPPPSPPPARDDIPPETNAHDADSLLRDARAWAREKQPEHVINDVRIAYVDSNGMLDADHGELEIVFGRTVRKVDDPKRKIGAPVAPSDAPNDCFQIVWLREAGWSRTTYGCSESYDVATRCTVKQIWKRAIDRKAPPEAVASLSMRARPAVGSWEIRIVDEPRGINFVETFADDCPLAVEK